MLLCFRSVDGHIFSTIPGSLSIHFQPDQQSIELCNQSHHVFSSMLHYHGGIFTPKRNEWKSVAASKQSVHLKVVINMICSSNLQKNPCYGPRTSFSSFVFILKVYFKTHLQLRLCCVGVFHTLVLQYLVFTVFNGCIKERNNQYFYLLQSSDVFSYIGFIFICFYFCIFSS